MKQDATKVLLSGPTRNLFNDNKPPTKAMPGRSYTTPKDVAALAYCTEFTALKAEGLAKDHFDKRAIRRGNKYHVRLNRRAINYQKTVLLAAVTLVILGVIAWLL